MPESLLPRYPAPLPGAFNIGMMHTSLNGSARHDVYAPCSVGDLDAHGYDYWALGHIHKRADYTGRSVVVMPGIPQGRDIGEAGAASVTLGILDDAGDLTLQEHSVAALRFERLKVELAGVEDWGQVVAAVTSSLRAAGLTARPEEHLVLRLQLTGNTSLAFRIARDLDQLRQEAVACAEGVNGLWIDKLENRTSGGGTAETRLPADLVAMVTTDLPKDPALMAALGELARDLVQDLPAELRYLLGDDENTLRRHCASLLVDGTAQLLPRLTMGEGS